MPWQPRPLSVPTVVPRPRVADLPRGKFRMAAPLPAPDPPRSSAWMPCLTPTFRSLPTPRRPWASGYHPQLTGLILPSLDIAPLFLMPLCQGAQPFLMSLTSEVSPRCGLRFLFKSPFLGTSRPSRLSVSLCLAPFLSSSFRQVGWPAFQKHLHGAPGDLPSHKSDSRNRHHSGSSAPLIYQPGEFCPSPCLKGVGGRDGHF